MDNKVYFIAGSTEKKIGQGSGTRAAYYYSLRILSLRGRIESCESWDITLFICEYFRSWSMAC